MKPDRTPKIGQSGLHYDQNRKPKTNWAW